MVKHYVIMSSSYTDGSRIALDITDEKLLNTTEISKIMQRIKGRCGDDVPLSTHFVETKSDSWESVRKYDPFFEGVECIKDESVFSEKISSGRVLSGLDVANYILSKLRCTHLSLEKLVYFAYADYLCEYSERLFEDNIYAFKHGPVVESVYGIYRRSGYRFVEMSGVDSDYEVRSEVKEMPAKSRILFARNGAQKLRLIDRAIEKYGQYSAGALVEITHREGSPWSKVDSSRTYQKIPDELIKKCHCVEDV